MSKRTLFLIFALFIITFVLLAITLYNPSSLKPTQIVMAPKESIQQTVLSFGEPVASSSSSTNVNYSVPINIETGKNKVTAVQLEMQYDPQILTNVAVAPGVFFKNPEVLLNQIDAKTGRITYAFGIGLTEQGTAGQGTAAILNFSVKAGTEKQTAILFLPKTLVTAEGATQTVLKTTTNAFFTVGVVPSTAPNNSSPSAQ